jgi:hypothetical protein
MDELNAVSGGDNTVTYNVMGCEFTVTGLANGSAMGIYSKTGDTFVVDKK